MYNLITALYPTGLQSTKDVDAVVTELEDET